MIENIENILKVYFEKSKIDKEIDKFKEKYPHDNFIGQISPDFLKKNKF